MRLWVYKDKQLGRCWWPPGARLRHLGRLLLLFPLNSSTQLTASSDVCCTACRHCKIHKFGTGFLFARTLTVLNQITNARWQGGLANNKRHVEWNKNLTQTNPFPLRNDKHCISGQCTPRAGGSCKNITINLLLSPQPVAVLITLFWQENPFPNKVWVAGKGRARHQEINSACEGSKESCSSGWLLSHHPAASTRHINTHATPLPPHHISITAECSAALFQNHFSLRVTSLHLNTDCP